MRHVADGLNLNSLLADDNTSPSPTTAGGRPKASPATQAPPPPPPGPPKRQPGNTAPIPPGSKPSSRLDAFEALQKEKKDVADAVAELEALEAVSMKRIADAEAASLQRIAAAAEHSMGEVAAAEKSLQHRIAQHKSKAAAEGKFLSDVRNELLLHQRQCDKLHEQRVKVLTDAAQGLAAEQVKLAGEKRRVRQQRFQLDMHLNDLNSVMGFNDAGSQLLDLPGSSSGSSSRSSSRVSSPVYARINTQVQQGEEKEGGGISSFVRRIPGFPDPNKQFRSTHTDRGPKKQIGTFGSGRPGSSNSSSNSTGNNSRSSSRSGGTTRSRGGASGSGGSSSRSFSAERLRGGQLVRTASSGVSNSRFNNPTQPISQQLHRYGHQESSHPSDKYQHNDLAAAAATYDGAGFDHRLPGASAAASTVGAPISEVSPLATRMRRGSPAAYRVTRNLHPSSNSRGTAGMPVSRPEYNNGSYDFGPM